MVSVRHAELADVVARALDAVYEPLLLHIGQGPAEGHPADAGALHELVFGGEARAVLQRVFPYVVIQIVRYCGELLPGIRHKTATKRFFPFPTWKLYKFI